MSEIDHPCLEETCQHDDPTEWKKCVTRQFQKGDARMASIEENVRSNTEAIRSIKNDTAELVEILKYMKTGVKVLGIIGSIVKWGAGLAVGIGSIISVFKGHGPGK